MKKFEYLDGLRGLACIMVVFSHCTLVFFPLVHNIKGAPITEEFPIQGFLNQSPFGMFWSGTAAVYIFFVLSGIVLAHSFAGKTAPFMPALFLARYLRLMIPALVSAVIAYLVFLVIGVVQPDFGQLRSWIGHLIVLDPNLPDAIYNGAIRPFWEHLSSYNVVLWTMGIELWGSFLIYLFCYGQRYIGVILCIAGAVFTIVAVFTFDPTLALGLSCFMIGLALHQLHIRISILPLAIFVLLLGLYFAGVHNNSVSYPFADRLFGHHGYLLINILSAPLVVLGVLSMPKVQTWLERPALVTIGRRSFAIYLIHLPVLYVSITVGELLFGYQESYLVKAFAVSAVVVAMSIALAKQMYQIDQIAMRVAKKVHK